MSESDKNAPDLLSKALDRLGIERELNKVQIWAYERMEFISTFSYRPWDPEDRVYYGGSQIEGTTIPELHSDLDILYPIKGMTVCEDYKSHDKVIGNLYQMVYNSEHPGFVKLKLVNQQAQSFAKADDQGFEYFYEDFHVTDPSDGTLILSNYKYHKGHDNIPGKYPHGPAYASDPTQIVLANDFVPCLKFNFWPSATNEWLERKRPFRFPSDEDVKRVLSKECFMVPIGSLKADGTRSGVDWRISFNLHERSLIWSWNITQRKLYVLLKILVRTILDPEFPDMFCSYHMKTLLFWLFEQTNMEFWQESNLSKCFEFCVAKLVEHVTDCYLPQYFIPGNNLFEKLSKSSEKERILDFLIRLNLEGWQLIRKCRFVEDAIASALEMDKLDVPKGKIMITPDQAFIIADHHYNVLQTFAEVRKDLLFRFLVADDLNQTISNHKKHLSDDFIKLLSYPDDDMRLLLLVHKMVQGSLGSHLLALAINKLNEGEDSAGQTAKRGENLGGDIKQTEKMSDSQSVVELMKTASEQLTACIETDATAGKLKLAGFHYYCKNYNKVFSLVADITANALMRGQITYLCGEQDIPTVRNKYFLSYIFRHKPTIPEQMNSYAAMEVVYLPTESACAPGAIKLEMFKVLSWIPIHKKDRWFHWAIIDPFVFAYYLEFLCYHEMGDSRKRFYSLKRLEKEVVEEVPIAHRDTGFNLLGHCYLILGEYVGSIAAYACSLEENPLHNVAHWMLLMLLYELYRDCKLPIFKRCLPPATNK